jgi:hypothetical protein
LRLMRIVPAEYGEIVATAQNSMQRSPVRLLQ